MCFRRAHSLDTATSASLIALAPLLRDETRYVRVARFDG
jgi:hypothetical protein